MDQAELESVFPAYTPVNVSIKKLKLPYPNSLTLFGFFYCAHIPSPMIQVITAVLNTIPNIKNQFTENNWVCP
jgi:hypothetical protein